MPSGATSGRSRSTTVKPRSSGTPGPTGTLGATGSGGIGTIGSVCATAATGARLKARPHAIIPAGSFRPIDFDPDLGPRQRLANGLHGPLQDKAVNERSLVE